MKIAVKLERDVLILKMDEERSYSEQRDDIEKYLSDMKDFLAGGKVKFSYEGAELSFDEEVELCNIADNVFETEVAFCHKKQPPRDMIRHVALCDEGITRKIKRNVLSGEIIESNGDIVVVGDVAAAAQLHAQGDIYVIGNLRGVAHAGYGGNEQALVYAMGMNGVMVKIADKIVFNSTNTESRGSSLAKIENGEIRIKHI